MKKGTKPFGGSRHSADSLDHWCGHLSHDVAAMRSIKEAKPKTYEKIDGRRMSDGAEGPYTST